MLQSLVWVQEEKLIGAGIATIALAGAAFGIGDCFKQLFGYAILGFALTEAIAANVCANDGLFDPIRRRLAPI